ncbi:MAG: hypothetical protein L0H53_16245 [Candidatus Nitrosocosmicus sp.]|nr:hypothetical protein [Candidatus Nitrosocosmicus sp.]
MDKDISRRTYYNYKKKLYDKDILKQLKNSMYDSQMMKCLLLDLEDTNKDESERADKLVAEQLPERKDIFQDTAKQQTELAKTYEMTNFLMDNSKKKFDKPVQIYNSTLLCILIQFSLHCLTFLAKVGYSDQRILCTKVNERIII